MPLPISNSFSQTAFGNPDPGGYSPIPEWLKALASRNIFLQPNLGPMGAGGFTPASPVPTIGFTPKVEQPEESYDPLPDEVSKVLGGVNKAIHEISPEDEYGRIVAGRRPVYTGQDARDLLWDTLDGKLPELNRIYSILPKNLVIAPRGDNDAYQTLNGIGHVFTGSNPQYPADKAVTGVASTMPSEPQPSYYNVSDSSPITLAHELGHNVQDILQSLYALDPREMISKIISREEDPDKNAIMNPGSGINKILEFEKGPNYNIGNNPTEFLSQIFGHVMGENPSITGTGRWDYVLNKIYTDAMNTIHRASMAGIDQSIRSKEPIPWSGYRQPPY